MKKSFLLLLLCNLTLFATPVISFVGIDETGSPMYFGSGMWQAKNGECYSVASPVDNRGTVTFLAQVQDVSFRMESNSEQFRGLYRKRQTENASSVLVRGYDNIALLLGSKWQHTCWQFLPLRNSENMLVLREDCTDAQGFTTLKLSTSASTSAFSLSQFNLPAPQSLSLTTGGNLAILSSNALPSPLLIDIQNNPFSQLDFPFPPGNDFQRTPVLPSFDGKLLFYTAIPENTGELHLKVFDRTAGTHHELTFLGREGLDPQIQCATNANDLVFLTTQLENASGGIQVAAMTLDNDKAPALQWCSNSPGLRDFAHPQISGDGRFVVFSARSGENTPLQTFRFDRLRNATEQVSIFEEQSANQDCQVPAISPNGRYITFTSATTNLGITPPQKPQVWLADMGPSLHVSPITVFQKQSAEIPILISGASDNAQILLTAEACPGTFLDCQGTPLSLNTPISLDALPLSFQCESPFAGTVSVQLHVADGAFSTFATLEIQIFPWDFAQLSCMSLNAQGEFTRSSFRSFKDIACSEDGSKVAFVTSLPILMNNKNNVFHAYLRDLSRGTLTLLSENLSKTVENIGISGDGTKCFFVSSQQLWQYETETGTTTCLVENGVSDLKPATDFSGTRIAFCQNGQLRLNEKIIATDNLRALRMNRDGRVIAFTNASHRLSIWFEATGTVESLAENVTEFAMNQAGTEIVFLQNNRLWRQSTAPESPTEIPLPEPLSTMEISSIQLSGNGRFLAGVAPFQEGENPSVHQQFLLNLQTAELQIISKNLTEPGNGSCSTVALAALAGSGRILFFASDANNFVPGDDNNAQDLFMAKLSPLAADSPRILNAKEDILEDTLAEIPLQLDSAVHNALVPQLVSSQTAQGNSPILMGPTPNRKGYAVQILPKENFCGTDSFEIQIWDGERLTAPLTVLLNVENTNDAPVATAVSRNLQEGEKHTLNLKEFVQDPDLANPPPWTDALCFALPQNAPAWISLAENEITLQPDFQTVTHQEAQREFQFEITVTDQAGATALLPITISVEDVNQPPSLQLLTKSLLQTGPAVIIPLDCFAATDPDPEDAGNLTFLFQDNKGTTAVSATSFPFSYMPDENLTNSIILTVQVQDSQGELSREFISLKILLQRVEFSATTLWGYVPPETQEDSPSWTALRRGWNLLSIPFAMNAEEIQTLFGNASPLWIWNQAESRYSSANAILPGQGFWIFLEDFSQISPTSIVLETGRSLAPPPTFGWYLAGPTWQEPAPLQGFRLCTERTWQKNQPIPTGHAGWLHR